MHSKVKIGHQNPPPGDDKLTFAGDMTLPVPYNPPLNPVSKGVRILLADASDNILLDATVPGGAYDPVTGTGWSTSASSWRYRSRTGVQGIVKVLLKPNASGLFKFIVGGKNGSYGVPANALPLHATLVIDSPTAMTGQCGEVHYGAGSCAFNGSATTVRCR
jgi:hypothetical protein